MKLLSFLWFLPRHLLLTKPKNTFMYLQLLFSGLVTKSLQTTGKTSGSTKVLQCLLSATPKLNFGTWISHTQTPLLATTHWIEPPMSSEDQTLPTELFIQSSKATTQIILIQLFHTKKASNFYSLLRIPSSATTTWKTSSPITLKTTRSWASMLSKWDRLSQSSSKILATVLAWLTQSFRKLTSNSGSTTMVATQQTLLTSLSHQSQLP